MIDISVMQHKFRSRYLVKIDNELSIVNIYENDKCKLEDAFIVLKPSKKLVGKAVCVEWLKVQELLIVLILVVIPF